MHKEVNIRGVSDPLVIFYFFICILVIHKYSGSVNSRYVHFSEEQCMLFFYVKFLKGGISMLWHSNSTPLSKRNEMCVHKKGLYKNIPNSFLHNSPKLETAHVSINRKLDKHPIVQSHICIVEYYSTIKRNKLLICLKTCWVQEVRDKCDIFVWFN